MKKISMLIGCLAASAMLVAQTYVTADKTGTELQAAIDAADAGTTVYVEAGTYYGNFFMKEGVNVSGGWDHTFTAQTDYATVLDAQSNGRVVEQPANFTTWTVWSNLTVQNGCLSEARTVPANGLGSGVALGKKGRVEHCLIQNNTFNYTSGNCMGGGVGNEAVDDATDILVDDCIIRNNCGTHGGGVRIRGTIRNSIIEDNNTNKSGKTGPAGGVHLQSGRMVNCIVRNNLAGGDTGGVRLYGKCQLINSLIVGNTATVKVGGVGVESANSDIIGCTIVANDQLTGNAGDNTRCGLSCGATSDNGTQLVNNVIWGNKHNGVEQAAQIYYVSHYNQENRRHNAVTNQLTHNDGSCIRLSLSNTEDGTCIDGSGDEQPTYAPHFADPENNDYRLTYLSPMLNRGNSAYSVVTEDMDGNPRIISAGADMGCYELPYYVLTVADFEHATLTVNGVGELPAGEYPLPKGYTTTATVTVEEGYVLRSVTVAGVALTPEDGVYTLPEMKEDVTLTIVVKSDSDTGLNFVTNGSSSNRKYIQGDRLIILREGVQYNAAGQVIR